MKRGFLGGISLAIILVFGFIIVNLLTVRVPAGYVGVKYTVNGGVKDDTLTQGWHIVSPTTHVTLYTVGIEQSYLTSGKNGDSDKDESFSAASSEGKDLSIDLTFTYQYDPTTVTEVFTRFKGQSGKSVRDSFIKPNIVSWTKEVIATYKVADILGAERASVNTKLTEYLSDKFKPYGINISNVSLIDVEVDEQTAAAINAKIAAQQNAETQKIVNQTNIEKAEADAKAKLTQANAEAKARLIEAEAEAEANNKLQKTLNQDILQQMWIDKWDGKVPVYMLGEDSNMIISPVSVD